MKPWKKEKIYNIIYDERLTESERTAIYDEIMKQPKIMTGRYIVESETVYYDLRVFGSRIKVLLHSRKVDYS